MFPHRSLQRFIVVKPLPKEEDERQALSNLMYKRMEAREEEGVAKLRQVIELVTADDCELSTTSLLSAV